MEKTTVSLKNAREKLGNRLRFQRKPAKNGHREALKSGAKTSISDKLKGLREARDYPVKITGHTRHSKAYISAVLEASLKAADPVSFAKSFFDNDPIYSQTSTGLAALQFETWIARNDHLFEKFVETIVTNGEETFLAIFRGPLDDQEKGQIRGETKDFATFETILDAGETNYDTKEQSVADVTIIEGTPTAKKNKQKEEPKQKLDALKTGTPQTRQDYEKVKADGGLSNEAFSYLYGDEPTQTTNLRESKPIWIDPKGVPWINTGGKSFATLAASFDFGNWIPLIEECLDTVLPDATTGTETGDVTPKDPNESEGLDPDYEAFKKAQAELEAEVEKAKAPLKDFDKHRTGATNLLPDEVRTSAPYRKAKGGFDKAFAALRDFNGKHVKKFDKQIKADRDARRAASAKTTEELHRVIETVYMVWHSKRKHDASLKNSSEAVMPPSLKPVLKKLGGVQDKHSSNMYYFKDKQKAETWRVEISSHTDEAKVREVTAAPPGTFSEDDGNGNSQHKEVKFNAGVKNGRGPKMNWDCPTLDTKTTKPEHIKSSGLKVGHHVQIDGTSSNIRRISHGVNPEGHERTHVHLAGSKSAFKFTGEKVRKDERFENTGDVADAVRAAIATQTTDARRAAQLAEVVTCDMLNRFGGFTFTHLHHCRLFEADRFVRFRADCEMIETETGKPSSSAYTFAVTDSESGGAVSKALFEADDPDEPEFDFTLDDVQCYYDICKTQSFEDADALEKVKLKFDLDEIEVSAAGWVTVPGLEDTTPDPVAPPPGSVPIGSAGPDNAPDNANPTTKKDAGATEPKGSDDDDTETPDDADDDKDHEEKITYSVKRRAAKKEGVEETVKAKALRPGQVKKGMSVLFRHSKNVDELWPATVKDTEEPVSGDAGTTQSIVVVVHRPKLGDQTSTVTISNNDGKVAQLFKESFDEAIKTPEKDKYGFAIQPGPWKVSMKQARADKEWAAGVDSAWLEKASDMSKQMQKERSEKSADELAMQHYAYWMLRAHSGARSLHGHDLNYPLDKGARSDWLKAGGKLVNISGPDKGKPRKVQEASTRYADAAGPRTLNIGGILHSAGSSLRTMFGNVSRENASRSNGERSSFSGYHDNCFKQHASAQQNAKPDSYEHGFHGREADYHKARATEYGRKYECVESAGEFGAKLLDDESPATLKEAFEAYRDAKNYWLEEAEYQSGFQRTVALREARNAFESALDCLARLSVDGSYSGDDIRESDLRLYEGVKLPGAVSETSEVVNTIVAQMSPKVTHLDYPEYFAKQKIGNLKFLAFLVVNDNSLTAKWSRGNKQAILTITYNKGRDDYEIVSQILIDNTLRNFKRKMAGSTSDPERGTINPEPGMSVKTIASRERLYADQIVNPAVTFPAGKLREAEEEFGDAFEEGQTDYEKESCPRCGFGHAHQISETNGNNRVCVACLGAFRVELHDVNDEATTSANVGGFRSAPLGNVTSSLGKLIKKKKKLKQECSNELDEAYALMTWLGDNAGVLADLEGTKQLRAVFAEAERAMFIGDDNDANMLLHLDERGLSDEDVTRYCVARKSILINNIWWTITKRDKAEGWVELTTSEWAIKDGHKKESKKVSWAQLIKNVNTGKWGVTIPGKGAIGAKQDKKDRAKRREKMGLRKAPGTPKVNEGVEPIEEMKPSTEKELKDAGISIAELEKAKADYEKAGLNLARVSGKGWRIYGIHDKLPRTFIQWASIDNLVHNRAEKIAAFKKMKTQSESVPVTCECGGELAFSEALTLVCVACGKTTTPDMNESAIDDAEAKYKEAEAAFRDKDYKKALDLYADARGTFARWKTNNMGARSAPTTYDEKLKRCADRIEKCKANESTEAVVNREVFFENEIKLVEAVGLDGLQPDTLDRLTKNFGAPVIDRLNETAGLDEGTGKMPPQHTQDTLALLTNTQINKLCQQADTESSKINDEFLAADRGSERWTDVEHKTDPLSLRRVAWGKHHTMLQIEKEFRYGPGSKYISSLPKGGPRVKKKTESMSVELTALCESADTKKKGKDYEPLKKTLTTWINKGNSFVASPPARTTEELDSFAYELQMQMDGTVVFTKVKPQTDELYRFHDSSMDKVIEEIDKFWTCKENYDKLGLMHVRGVMMYGPPGTGKSSALQQVVEMMTDRGDVVFFAKDVHTIKAGLRAFREVETNRKVVVCFEEAEQMCGGYHEREFLQLLDGDSKINNVLYLATTNYIDQISERILRPGRFDSKVYIGPPGEAGRRAYLTAKLKETKLAEDDKIESLIKATDGMSFGHLRELLVGAYALGEPTDKVLKRLRERRDVMAARTYKSQSDVHETFAPKGKIDETFTPLWACDRVITGEGFNLDELRTLYACKSSDYKISFDEWVTKHFSQPDGVDPEELNEEKITAKPGSWEHAAQLRKAADAAYNRAYNGTERKGKPREQIVRAYKKALDLFTQARDAYKGQKKTDHVDYHEGRMRLCQRAIDNGGIDSKEESIDDLTEGEPVTLFTVDSDDKSFIEEIKKLPAPFVKAYVTALGGNDRASIMFTISLEPKEKWDNGIIENSNYAKGSISRDGTIEVFSGSFHRKSPFRKTKVKTQADAIKKLAAWIEKSKIAVAESGEAIAKYLLERFNNDRKAATRHLNLHAFFTHGPIAVADAGMVKLLREAASALKNG